MKKIRLASNLSLPLDAVTYRIAILAVSGAGKTYTTLKIVEQVFKANLPVVVIDPGGGCWGLRSSSDGKSPGLPIVIMGGDHGDVPLESTAGKEVADFVVDERASVVLDLSEFESKAEQLRFMLDFGQRLYYRKHKQRDPLLLVGDEFDEFAPQRPMKGEERCLGMMDRLVRRGRFRGIFPLVDSQRSAALNKNVLTQCQILIAMRTSGVQDIDAIDAWIEKQGGTKEQRAIFLADTAKLPTGMAYVWAPVLDIFEKVKIAERETFDSSATPKIGERLVEPKTLAEIDLAGLQRRMAATVERAKQEDPKLLRAEIAKLKAEKIRPQPQAKATREVVKEKRVEIPIVKATQVARLTKAVETLNRATENAKTIASTASGMALEITTSINKAKTPQPTAKWHHGAGVSIGFDRPIGPPSLPQKPLLTKSVNKPDSGNSVENMGGDLTKGEKAILVAVAQHLEAGVTREQLTVLTGYKRSSRDTYLQRLQAKGYIGIANGQILASRAGVDALGDDFVPLPTGSALLNWWLGRLPEGERRVLEVVVAQWPDNVNRDAISDATGYRRSSRDTYLQRLGARELVESATRATVRASDQLFDQ